MGVVNVSTVVRNKVTKTVSEKKKTDEKNSRCSERGPLTSLDTQSSGELSSACRTGPAGLKHSTVAAMGWLSPFFLPALPEQKIFLVEESRGIIGADFITKLSVLRATVTGDFVIAT